MRELGALGRAGGARGIQDHGVVITGLVRHRGRRGEPGEQRVQIGLVDLEDLRARPGGALGCFHRRLVPGEQDFRAGIPDVVGDLAALQQRVHRHDDGPGGERTVEGDREGGHVRQHDADPVTRHNPQRRQQGRRAACGVPQLRVAQHQVVQAHSRALAMIGRRLRKHGTQVRHHALQQAAPCQMPPRCIIPRAGGKWTEPMSPQIRTFVPTCADAPARAMSGGLDCPRVRVRASSGLMPRNSCCVGHRPGPCRPAPADESDASNCAERRSGRGRRRTGRPGRAGNPGRRRQARPCSMIGTRRLGRARLWICTTASVRRWEPTTSGCVSRSPRSRRAISSGHVSLSMPRSSR